MEEKYKVHFFYIIGILLAIIIGLISVEWAKIPYLVEYITFALTLSSLLLAILAIVYSMISNNTFSGLIEKLNSSAEYLQESSRKVSTGYDMILEKFQEIPSSINDVRESVYTTHDLLKKATEESFKNTATEKESGSEEKKPLTESLLETTTIRGLETIFLLNQSYLRKKPFSWDDLNKFEDFKSSIGYMQGYTFALRGLGIIDQEVSDDGEILTVSIDEYISNNIDRIARQRIEEEAMDFEMEVIGLNSQKEADNERLQEAAAEWANSLRVIEDYFRHGLKQGNNKG